MNNIAIAATKSVRETRAAILPEDEVAMLRSELELMIQEDAYMKKVLGAAARLISRLDRVQMPGGAVRAALSLASLIEAMPEKVVGEAMNSFRVC
jgi:hypothetical protein